VLWLTFDVSRRVWFNSNVYSAVNAVVGHYNNFGTKAPIPKKRAERIVKELKDAELALSRGR